MILPQVVYHMITIKVTVLSKSNTLQQTQSSVGILFLFRTYDEDHRGQAQTNACLSPVVNLWLSKPGPQRIFSDSFCLAAYYCRASSRLGPFPLGTGDLSPLGLSISLVKIGKCSTQESANKSLF